MKSAVVLSCDDNFVAYASVVARRVAALSSESFPIFLVSDNVSAENKRLAQQFCPRISFVEVGDDLDGLPIFEGGHLRRATYGRLRLDEVVDADRILYLDCDISVLADVAPLLELPLKTPIAATFGGIVFSSEVQHRAMLGMSEGSPCFNAGVMLFDAKAVRQEGIFRNALKYALDYPERVPYADQDALNAVVNGHWQLLDWRWNVTFKRLQSKPPFIRHFVGSVKPWSNRATASIEAVYIDQWRADLLESPWPHRFERVGGPTIRPFAKTLEFLKTVVHCRSAGPRGEKARAFLRYRAIQADMEKAAASLSLAPKFPERAIAITAGFSRAKAAPALSPGDSRR